MKEKRKSRFSPARKVAIVIISILLAIAVLFFALRIGELIAFAPFFSRAKAEFNMPGISSGFIGQGLDYLKEQKAFLTCGYSANKGKPSSVYYIDEKGNSTKCELKKADGSAYTGHTGGIAHYGNYVYITGADGCDVFSLSDFTEKKSEARKIGEIKSPAGHDPAFVTIHGNKLYEGSFYRSGNYETPDNERITTPSGDENKALLYVYDLGGSENFGVSEKPVAAYSTCGLVQGMTIRTDGNKDVQMILSCSWGVSPSHLYFYDLTAIPPVTRHSVTVDGQSIPLYFLDSSCLSSTVTAPPMSEEIVYKDGRIYIMTESASNKYIFGKFMSGSCLFSYKV